MTSVAYLCETKQQTNKKQTLSGANLSIAESDSVPYSYETGDKHYTLEIAVLVIWHKIVMYIA